jgi:hypothetical protein
MRKKSRRAFSGRVLTAVVAALALSVSGAGIASSSAEPAKRGGGATVFMRAGKNHSLKFVGPETIRTGQSLRVVSKTSARVHGPHTFSLVNRSALPKTRPARRSCFAPGHICREIARWHGSNGNTPPTKNPAKAGADGWDTSGSTSKNGDSWFTARRNASITQDVSLNVPGKPKRLFFLCAIHPFMQGSIKVLP